MFVTNFSWCHPHHNTKLHECRTGLPRHLLRIEIKRIKCIMSDMQLFGLAHTITLSKIRQRAGKLPHCVATICFIHGIYGSYFKKWRGSFCNKSCVRTVPPCINDSKNLIRKAAYLTSEFICWNEWNMLVTSPTTRQQERNCQEFCLFWSKVSSYNVSPKQLPVHVTNKKLIGN